VKLWVTAIQYQKGEVVLFISSVVVYGRGSHFGIVTVVDRHSKRWGKLWITRFDEMHEQDCCAHFIYAVMTVGEPFGLQKALPKLDFQDGS